MTRVVGLKTIRNFAVANICALLPLLWIAVSWMPNQVKVYWRGDAPRPVALEADGMVLQGEDYGSWKGGMVWRFYLREGMEWKNLTFLLPQGRGSGDVERIDLQKWKLLRLEKVGAELEPAGGDENGWRFAKPRFTGVGFGSRSAACGLAGLEALLLGLSWLFAKRHREEQWKTLAAPTLLVALVLTAILQVVLPVQSYLGNESAYPFSFGALVGALAARFPWALVLTVLAIGLSARCFGRRVLGVVLAFAVCVYLEAGILSEGLPSLNGDWWFFQNRTRAMWDTAVWLAVFVSVAAMHPVVKRCYGLGAACLLIMAGASMFDIKHEQKADTSKLVVHDFLPIETVVRSVTFSTNRNVLVFVIDSLEREQAHTIMEDPEAGAELREKFRGFTEYIDNVGAWSTSLPSIANMLTGRLPEGAAGLADYFVSPYSDRSVLQDFLEAGCDVHLATEALGFGWSSRSGIERRGEGAGNVLLRRTDGELGWNLMESVRFQWFPFAGKYQLAALTGLAIAKDEDWGDEATVFNVLRQAGIRENASGTFAFFHTRGVHGPLIRGRDGTLLSESRDDVSAHIETGIWVLRQLGALLDALRGKDVFDQSLILVLADHGNHGHGRPEEEGLPGNGRPFLWIKAPESRHAFTTSQAPTYSGKIADLLRAASRETLTEERIANCLSAPVREYRLMPEFGGTIRVWSVAGAGTCSTREETLSTGELVPLATGIAYPLDKSGLARQNGSIVFSGVGFWPAPVLLPGHLDMRLQFRVPDARKRYALRLAFKMTQDKNGAVDPPGASLILEQGGREAIGTEVPIAYRTEAILKGLQPDGDGCVTVAGRRANGLNANVFFLELTLEEE